MTFADFILLLLVAGAFGFVIAKLKADTRDLRETRQKMERDLQRAIKGDYDKLDQ